MTFKEKLAMEHPEYVKSNFEGGCRGCPCDYDYEQHQFNRCDYPLKCTECWNRTSNKTEEKSMGDRKQNEAPILLEGDYNLVINGKEILLVDIETGECARAVCHEDDEFYICTGVDIAFTRLLEHKYGGSYKRLNDAFTNVYREDA